MHSLNLFINPGSDVVLSRFLYVVYRHGDISFVLLSVIRVQGGSCIYPPLNDDCINAVMINCNSSVVGNNTGASANANATFVGGPAIWYEVIGTGGDITISTCGTLFDTRLMVYDSCGTSAYIAYNDDFNDLVHWKHKRGYEVI